MDFKDEDDGINGSHIIHPLFFCIASFKLPWPLTRVVRYPCPPLRLLLCVRFRHPLFPSFPSPCFSLSSSCSPSTCLAFFAIHFCNTSHLHMTIGHSWRICLCHFLLPLQPEPILTSRPSRPFRQIQSSIQLIVPISLCPSFPSEIQ